MCWACVSSSSSPASGFASSLALIALGSNLGDSAALIRRAMDELQQLSHEPIRKSSLWETTPVDCPPGSPKFVNAAVVMVPREKETPESLLKKLQALEKQFGREQKKVLNEARLLDLDLIAFGAERRSSSVLTLPHPRARSRRFVLQPLAEIVPHFIFPGEHQSVAELLVDLPSDEIRL
jgi:2-amino-4-hydroxy-6-hydroxymethyldihydropteridine diphosphokinase